MANYTTIAGLQKRIKPTILAELVDDVNATPDITDATAVIVANQAITDASRIIDGYLYQHTDMSAADTQAHVEPLCADIAIYRLFQRRYAGSNNKWDAAYEDAMINLKEFATGIRHIASTSHKPDVLIDSVNADVTDRDFDDTSGNPSLSNY